MIINIRDIHAEGREFSFSVAAETLNSRGREALRNVGSTSIAPPDYEFFEDPQVCLTLSADGRSISVAGEACGQFTTRCARCVEEASQELRVAIDVVLKPKSSDSKEGSGDVDDLFISYYEGEEIDISALSEEYLILGLPFTVYCQENCAGLCSGCGKNLNLSECECEDTGPKDERFAVLSQLKIS